MRRRARAERHDHQARHFRLSVAARCQIRSWRAECGDRREWQRQVEPLSRRAPFGGHRSGPHHPIARRRGRPAFDTVGRAGIVLARDEGRRAAGARHSAQGIFAGKDYGYAIDLVLPVPSSSHFARDPEIKAESQSVGETLTRANVFAVRNGPSARVRDQAGAWRQVATHLPPFDSMMTHCSDPRDAPELLLLRDRMRDCRFYDHFRTDREAPVRRPQVGTYTPVLGSDGHDLPAAMQTIREIGNPAELGAAISDAFPGSKIEITTSDGYFELEMRQHGLLRPLKAAELSDGTLRYLLLIAALLSPRPPDLMILNEPETSLHPDLLPPLARLIAQAAQRAQIIVVSHAEPLVSALAKDPRAQRIVLEKQLGETLVQPDERPSWTWPTR